MWKVDVESYLLLCLCFLVCKIRIKSTTWGSKQVINLALSLRNYALYGSRNVNQKVREFTLGVHTVIMSFSNTSLASSWLQISS